MYMGKWDEGTNANGVLVAKKRGMTMRGKDGPIGFVGERAKVRKSDTTRIGIHRAKMSSGAISALASCRNRYRVKRFG